ncbi:MAG: hypothetical protein ACLPUO_04745 [Streptosporangiaceae bacterium]
MRDPDLVLRAQRAASELERAWHRWRTMHGLEADPLPPVSSYVGYSLEEPWGQPRVVFGVDAEEAEQLAAVLDGHDCVGPIHAKVAGLPGVRQPAKPQAPERPADTGLVQVPAQAAASDDELSLAQKPAGASGYAGPSDPRELEGAGRPGHSPLAAPEAGAAFSSSPAGAFADAAALQDAPVFREAAAVRQAAALESPGRKAAAAAAGVAESGTGEAKAAGPKAGGARAKPAASDCGAGREPGAGREASVSRKPGAAAGTPGAAEASAGREAAARGDRDAAHGPAANDRAANEVSRIQAADSAGLAGAAPGARADETPASPLGAAPDVTAILAAQGGGSPAGPSASAAGPPVPGVGPAPARPVSHAFHPPAAVAPDRGAVPGDGEPAGEQAGEPAVVAFRPRPELAAYLDEGPEFDPFLDEDDDEPLASPDRARHRRLPRAHSLPRLSRPRRGGSQGDRGPSGPAAGPPPAPEASADADEGPGSSSMAADVAGWTAGELPGQAAANDTAV